MNGKVIVILGVAAACGVGAMVGVNRLIARSKVAEPESREVLVAARDLKVEEAIAPDLVKVARLPVEAVPAGSFQAFKDVEGRWAQIPILAGEPIVDAKLAPRGAPPGLVAKIPPGHRAVGVEVNEQTGVSGFIKPGHRVDVIRSLERAGSDAAGPAATILEDVLVLAVGQVIDKADGATISARTVTLAVAPVDAERLSLASGQGPLTLSLRGLNDRAKVARAATPEPKPEPQPEPPKPEPPPPPAPPPPAPVVVVAPPAPPPPRVVWIFRGPGRPEVVRVGATTADPEPATATAMSGDDPAESRQVAARLLAEMIGGGMPGLAGPEGGSRRGSED